MGFGLINLLDNLKKLIMPERLDVSYVPTFKSGKDCRGYEETLRELSSGIYPNLNPVFSDVLIY